MIGVNSINNKNSNQLEDYAFRPHLEWVGATITGSKYDLMIHELWKRLNADSILAEFEKSVIESTVNSYINLLTSDSTIPTYNWWYVEREPRKPYTDLVNRIANASQNKVEQVKRVLKHLEFADKDGSIAKGYHNPRVVDNTVSKLPDSADSFKKQIDVQKIVKYGAIGLGAFLLIKVISIVD